jgi:ribosomal protein S16
MSKTKMLLQRIGCRNHPYFKIVVMKSPNNLRGKYIEHVGYW